MMDGHVERAELVQHLFWSAQHGERRVVKGLIDQFRGDALRHGIIDLEENRVSTLLNEQDSDGWTALHFAAQGGLASHTNMVKLLCDEGANVNARSLKGLSPLHVAAQFAEPDAISILINAAADRALQDDRGMTPRACANGMERRKALVEPQTLLMEMLLRIRDHLPVQCNALECRPAKDLDEERTLCENVDQQISATEHEIHRLKARIDIGKQQPNLFPPDGSQVKDLQRQLSDAQYLVARGQEYREYLKKRLANDHLTNALSAIHERLADLNPDTKTLIGKPTRLPKQAKEKVQVYRHALFNLDAAYSMGMKNRDDLLKTGNDIHAKQYWSAPELRTVANEIRAKIIEMTSVGEGDMDLSKEHKVLDSFRLLHRVDGCRMRRSDLGPVVRKTRLCSDLGRIVGKTRLCSDPCQIQ